MAVAYSARMMARQSLPDLWLLSDERNDDRLELALETLPPGSGFVFRHYHLAPQERLARYLQLRTICRARSHLLILADSALTAREWGADGIYGAPRSLYPARRDLIAIATAHDLREVAQANLKCADAVILSPVFATRSHPAAKVLGPLRFHQIARHARMPVIALGGMDQRNADRLAWPRWAAIDGLS
jgi:thiamine-phosphate pyrophosphorylase